MPNGLSHIVLSTVIYVTVPKLCRHANHDVWRVSTIDYNKNSSTFILHTADSMQSTDNRFFILLENSNSEFTFT